MEKEAEEVANIEVAIRIRPMLEKELSTGEFEILKAEDKLIVVFDPLDIEFERQNKQTLDVYHRSREQRYAFDHIFTLEPVEKMYAKTVHGLIEPLFRGFNGCVFAYGATGTGKTHTMLGSSAVDGLNLLAVREIFDRREEMTEHSVDIYVSYVEVYNEQIRDLLAVRDTGICELRDDPLKGVMLTGATESRALSLEEVKNSLFAGNKRRTTEATNANLTSSRSHAIFQITIDVCPRTKDIALAKTTSKLSMIDLAGSERGTVTENRGLRLREGAKINQSLLALANCINALGDRGKKGAFVPYRDSKLTRMLKDSLGGNCKTVMVVTVSPSMSQFEETLNTLKYANRAKNIATKPVENKKLVEFHVAEYRNIISELKQEIASLRLQLPEAGPAADCTCHRDREKDRAEAEEIRSQLVENFRERIQLRRGLCELSAQNQLNEMEIREGEEKLLQYRLSRSGKLVAKETLEDVPLPRHLTRELSDISQLQISLDYNESQKKRMKEELEAKTAQARCIIDSLHVRIRSADQRHYLEMIVKSHILELENDEMEYSLHLQEKLNLILVDEIKRLRNICTRNRIALSEGEDEGSRPEGLLKHRKQKTEVFCENVNEKPIFVEKSSTQSATKKKFCVDTLPPISEFLPTLKTDKRYTFRHRSKDREAEGDKPVSYPDLGRENKAPNYDEKRKQKFVKIPKLKTKNFLK